MTLIDVLRPLMNLNGKRERLSRVRTSDVLACALIIALGALQFAFPLRSDDFFMGDTIYVELAQSILESGRYGVDYNDVQYPPGLPALLALLCRFVGCNYGVIVRSMSIYLALGLVLSYWLLKREGGTAVAATACLLIASSPVVFALSTHGVSSDLPYFLASMATLSLATLLDRVVTTPARTLLLGLVCSGMLVTSLLIRSSGVALISGLLGWLAVGALWTDRATRFRRLRRFAGVLLVGIFVQSVWMAWVAGHETIEWPSIQGHPRTYLSHLIVKDGIRPELGTATFTDIVERVPPNLVDRATGFMQLLTRKDYIEAAWYSPPVFGAVLLISIGLGASLRPAGGTLMEWYFMSHEAMYLVWPWPFEMRFLLPVAPLACLYLWRGGKTLAGTVVGRPRVVGAAGAFIGLLAGATAGAVAWTSESMQPRLAAIFWSAMVLVSVWMLLPDRSKRGGSHAQSAVRASIGLAACFARLRLPSMLGMAMVAGLVALGVMLQVKMGLENLTFDVTQNPSYGSISAARWIAENAADDAVVMARQLDVVHHYAHRKVVWFPPISDPQTLMQGIRRLDANFIVVTKTWNYYRPSDVDSIEVLLREYPHSFRTVKEDPKFRIIEVSAE